MTNKAHERQRAVLVLEDGTYFAGISCGSPGEVTGEIGFNTTMIGYPEVISDPANAGRIVVMTYPQIGNYGVARADLESDRAALRALVVRDICTTPSNYRSNLALPEYLAEQGIVAATEIDTRALAGHIRENGKMRAVLSTTDTDLKSLLAKAKAATLPSDENLVHEVSTAEPYLFEISQEHLEWHGPLPPPRFKVIVVDLGATRSSLNTWARLGMAAIVLPWDTAPETILSYHPDGVVFSSGPGDPRVLAPTVKTAAALMGKLPMLGIGLGQSVLALAAGGSVGKLKAGHHGGNYPVANLLDGSVSITSQNHGFGVRFDSLGSLTGNAGRAAIVANPACGRIQLTEVNLNDGTVEGLSFLDVEAFGVQYHPEFAPGPLAEAPHPYSGFVARMAARASATPTVNEDPSLSADQTTSDSEADHA